MPFAFIRQFNVGQNKAGPRKEADRCAVLRPRCVDETFTFVDLPEPGLVVGTTFKAKAVGRQVPNGVFGGNQTVHRGVSKGKKRFTIVQYVDERNLEHFQKGRIRVQIGAVLSQRCHVFTAESLKADRGRERQ